MRYVATVFSSGEFHNLSFFQLLYPVGQALDGLYLASSVRNRCVKSLYKTCADRCILPRSLQIEPSYNPADVPHSRGGFADVWKGQYRKREVGVKVLRIHTSSDLEKVIHVSYR